MDKVNIFIAFALCCSLQAACVPPRQTAINAADVACSVDLPRKVETSSKGYKSDPVFVFGNERFSTYAPKTGKTILSSSEVKANGGINVKWPWLFKKSLTGDITVTGTLVLSDSSKSYSLLSNPESAEAPDQDPADGVIVSYLSFPVEGCWRITAQKGSEHFEFVHEVIVES